VFKFLNRRPSATSKANAVALSGLVTEAAAKNFRLQVELANTRGALKNIVSSIDSINTPNGTLRKVRRIAENAL
jgi:hypothetical protein